ncbi:hypothetical protein [Nocardia cyriacigeorgica]|uniref:hypothetical protein n=1 Tax=Nocardia cyriacigeorgica TaxID=135487 RepID=UPI0015E31B94|nr:hypothetical protein [Nocardia cyriacigeorgica]
MALGELPITHNAFAGLPSTRPANYVRDLLTASGVLPPYEPALERIVPWLTQLLTTLPREHADLVDRFARWKLLHRLRRLDTVTRGAAQHTRATILATTRFLTWLDTNQTTLTALTQATLDRYLADHPGTAPTLEPFLVWASGTGLTETFVIPTPKRPQPQVTVSHDERWRHVDTLLHDDTIRVYTRIAGLFMLLFAQPISRICRMRIDQVSIADTGAVSVAFDTDPIEMPAPLDQIIVDHLNHGAPASYANAGYWLFPGRIPGKHLVTESIRQELVYRGIHPSHARKAAMFHLAAEMPTPVLADLLGLSTTTATRWGHLAARDWNNYTALRHDTSDRTFRRHQQA